MTDFTTRFIALFKENIMQGSQHYTDHYEHLKQQALERVDKAKNEYRRSARRWGYVHKFLGITVVLLSVASAVFTLSTNQTITITLSLLSAIFAGVMTFLNPADMEVKFRTAISDCLNFNNEVVFASVVIQDKSTSEEDKMRKLEELNRSLKFLDEKLSKII